MAGTACLGEDKGEEEDLDGLEDGKADTMRKPTDHGYIFFGLPEHSALTEDARFHAWTFELTGDAKVDMTTSYSVQGQRRTDTVLYLYKEAANGWGSYIARNDDYGSTTYSQLIKNLGAGKYRVLVKGHLASTRGKFKVTVGCQGDGCAPPPSACVFGDTYNDIFDDNPNITVINRNKIYPNTLATLNPEDRHRLMLAVQQSAHDDVTTPEEAIQRVDQQEVNVVWLAEENAQRAFISFEYGSGDNSYGAIFDRHSGEMVTNIHDGDLESCDIGPKTCLLPDDWSALRSDPAFTTVSSRVATTASQLTGITGQQALLAFQQSYDDVTTVAQGLANVDDNRVNVVQMKHTATGTLIDVIEYGAGDTSVGRIFYKGTTDRAGIINDLSIEGCTLFE
ncbi:MAG: DVUA0089 family protein [Kofleriaceae bacterium]|nr:DVUA0089 family protein [Kofleriaceae bacterium]